MELARVFLSSEERYLKLLDTYSQQKNTLGEPVCGEGEYEIGILSVLLQKRFYIKGQEYLVSVVEVIKYGTDTIEIPSYFISSRPRYLRMIKKEERIYEVSI